MSLTYKTIVITGASSGIGAALADQFAVPGVTLGLIARNADRLNRIAENCRKRGANVEMKIIDVQDRENLQSWLQQFDTDHPIDLLIANAGITYPLPRRELHEPQEEVTNILNTNFTGVLNTVIPAIDRMQERKRGHIAILSSLSAYHGIPAFPAYSASKAALLSYFQAIRSRLTVAGIDLTIICPGYIETPMTKKLPGLKMLVLPVDKAATIIKDGLIRKKPLLAFPFQLRIGLWFMNCLPVNLCNWILIKVFGINKL